MIRHVVMFAWKPGVTSEQLAVLQAALHTLPPQIPEIRSYTFGVDAQLMDGNYDFALVADFDDVESFHAYAAHPAHHQVIEEHVLPIRGGRAAVQFEI